MPTKPKADADADAADDEIGEAIESVDEPDPNLPPAPIVATSNVGAVNDRVLYEDAINADARAFARQAELAYIDARINGHEIEIVVTKNEE